MDRMIGGIIYKVTNLINGKIYIGQTTMTLEKRWINHCGHSGGLCRTGRLNYLGNAIRKYGKNNFSIEIIDTASNCDELDSKEIQWIAKLHSTNRSIGYNITAGGAGWRAPEGYVNPKKGKFKHSAEAKAKISAALKGTFTDKQRAAMQRKLSRPGYVSPCKGIPIKPETRAKISATQKGRKVSPEALKRLRERNPFLGKHHTEETKRKLSEIKKGKPGHPLSENAIQALRNRVMPAEQRKQISERMKGVVFSEETKRKMSLAKKGKLKFSKKRENVGKPWSCKCIAGAHRGCRGIRYEDRRRIEPKRLLCECDCHGPLESRLLPVVSRPLSGEPHYAPSSRRGYKLPPRTGEQRKSLSEFRKQWLKDHPDYKPITPVWTPELREKQRQKRLAWWSMRGLEDRRRLTQSARESQNGRNEKGQFCNAFTTGLITADSKAQLSQKIVAATLE